MTLRTYRISILDRTARTRIQSKIQASSLKDVVNRGHRPPGSGNIRTHRFEELGIARTDFIKGILMAMGLSRETFGTTTIAGGRGHWSRHVPSGGIQHRCGSGSKSFTYLAYSNGKNGIDPALILESTLNST